MLFDPIQFTRSRFERFSTWFGSLLDQTRLSEPIIMIGTAILTGLATGFGVVGLIRSIGWVEYARHTLLDGLTGWGAAAGLVGFLALAGVIVAIFSLRLTGEPAGHGVARVMEAVALHGGILRARVFLNTLVTSAITLGAGGSSGREAPSVQIGAALGSTVGQVFNFSSERIRTLVACGAAAGISAAFNAPIAGALYALEVILGRFTTRYFGAVVISSVSAAIVGRAILGNHPAFSVPAYALEHLNEFFVYLALGVISAIIAAMFVWLVKRLDVAVSDWHARPEVKAMLGMAGVGFLALLLPGGNILGSGLEFIGETFSNAINVPILLLVATIPLKMLATSLTIGTGNAGGIFAPALFLGAVTGGLVGRGADALWPDLIVHPEAYAIVGMAAVFAGTVRAPITGVLLVFEMSNDYRLILPLMTATVISTLLSELMVHSSVDAAILKRKGITLQQGRDLDILQSVTAAEVMSERSPISGTTTLREALDLVVIKRFHGFPVLDAQQRLTGVVTVGDIDRALMRGLPDSLPVGQIATPRERLLVAFPDETIDEVLTRMSTRGLGRLPVVAREDPGRLVGMIRREDVMRAYQLASARRAEVQQRARQMEVRNIDGTVFMEFELAQSHKACGKTLRDIGPELPGECVIVSIRRGGRAFIPHGSTIFSAGDKITAFAHLRDKYQLAECLLGEQEIPTVS